MKVKPEFVLLTTQERGSRQLLADPTSSFRDRRPASQVCVGGTLVTSDVVSTFVTSRVGILDDTAGPTRRAQCMAILLSKSFSLLPIRPQSLVLLLIFEKKLSLVEPSEFGPCHEVMDFTPASGLYSSEKTA